MQLLHGCRPGCCAERQVAVPRRGFSRCNYASTRLIQAPTNWRCSPPEGIFTVQLGTGIAWSSSWTTRTLRCSPPEGIFTVQLDPTGLPPGTPHPRPGCSPPEGIFTVQLWSGWALIPADAGRVAVPRRGFSRCNSGAAGPSSQPTPEGLQSPGGDFHGATPGRRLAPRPCHNRRVAVPRRGFSRCNPVGTGRRAMVRRMDLVAVPRRGFSRCNAPRESVGLLIPLLRVAVPRRGFSRCNSAPQPTGGRGSASPLTLQSPGGDFHGATDYATQAVDHRTIQVAVPRRGFSRCN